VLNFVYSSVDSMVNCKCAFTAKRRGKADILYICSTEKLQKKIPEFSPANSLNYEYDESYQLDATVVIYYHKYIYMFRAFICPSSGVQVVC